jgi:hypothetical protein
MGRKMLVPVGGIYALVFSALVIASVVAWHSRLILLISAVGFGTAVFAILLGLLWRLHWRKEELNAKTWFYHEPHFETFTASSEDIKPPVQSNAKRENPLDIERVRSRLTGQRNLANAASAIKGEKHNARILYNRELRKYHLTDADVLERIEKGKGK